MEESTPCPGCGEIVELEAMRQCRLCRELFCRDCLDELRECGVCRERVDLRPTTRPQR